MTVPIETAVERLIDARFNHHLIAPLSETYTAAPRKRPHSMISSRVASLSGTVAMQLDVLQQYKTAWHWQSYHELVAFYPAPHLAYRSARLWSGR
jgi:hypothetical protein